MDAQSDLMDSAFDPDYEPASREEAERIRRIRKKHTGSENLLNVFKECSSKDGDWKPVGKKYD